jgi:hypothetical protein
MLPSLACAARKARLNAGLAYAHVAVRVRKRDGRVGVSESTIARFELARHWPENPDAMLKAYAEATGTPAHELWDAAIAALCR